MSKAAAMTTEKEKAEMEKEAMFQMAQQEMEYRIELFNKMTMNCFNKCCASKEYRDAELNTSETACVDRCVAKYWQVTTMVGQLLGTVRPSG